MTPSHFLFGDNLHEKLKKISEEQKLIKQAFSVLGKNMSNNTRNFRKRSRSSRGVGAIAERLYSETSTKRMSISRPSTNRRKKTLRLTSDWETKVFSKRMGKNLHRQNSFKLCKRIRNSFDFKTFSAQDSRLNPRILNRVSFIKIRARQIASERSNRTSGKFRTRIICEPPFHSSEIKWPKTSCYQSEAAKQTRFQSKISNGKPGKYSFTSETGKLHDKDRLTGRIYVGAGCTKIKKSSSFYFRWKDLPVQSDAFWPELCTKNIYQTVQTNSQTAEVSRSAFDYIFGRYTSNCSNSRSVPSSGQILNETTSRSGILSENEQVSSYSHPKNNFSGFSDRLCKYDNFSPRGKTISNNSKGQFIVASKFGLYSKPVSVCGHVFSNSPSIKASAFVLQENSTVNKQSFKQTWSKQETMLQSENSTKLSGSSELAVVGRRNATTLLSSSIFPTSRCENSNQLIFPGLGCNYGACQNSRSLGMGKAVVPHKQERTADLFHCSGIFCFPSKRHSCSAVSGQYCCCKLSESCRGDKVTSFVRSHNCNLGMVFTEKNLPFSNSHTRHCNKTPDGLSRQKLESTEWMLDSSVFRQIVAVYQQPQLDLFASHHNHQLPNYFSWIPDPQAMGTDAFSIPWKFNLCYLFPPFPLIQKCIQKIKRDK